MSASPFTFVAVASTDGVKLRRHNVPVLTRTGCVIARRHGKTSPTPGAVMPPLFARSEGAQSLILKLAAGMNAASPTYVETKWKCEEVDGVLVLPEEAIEKIKLSLASQDVQMADGSITHPWRLATAEESVTLVEKVDDETRSSLNSILAQHGMAPRGTVVAAPVTPTLDPGMVGRIEAMEAELAELRQEKAEREEAERRAAEKAALRAELLAELKQEVEAEAKAKAQQEKQQAEAAELVELRKKLAAVEKGKTGSKAE